MAVYPDRFIRGIKAIQPQGFLAIDPGQELIFVGGIPGRIFLFPVVLVFQTKEKPAYRKKPAVMGVGYVAIFTNGRQNFFKDSVPVVRKDQILFRSRT